MKKTVRKITAITAGFFPYLALAATYTDTSTVGGVFGTVQNIIENNVIPFLLVLATAVFLWGVIKYISAAGEEDQSEGRRLIGYGLIGLAVMVSVWGLVKILTTTFITNNEGIPTEIGTF